MQKHRRLFALPGVGKLQAYLGANLTKLPFQLIRHHRGRPAASIKSAAGIRKILRRLHLLAFGIKAVVQRLQFSNIGDISRHLPDNRLLTAVDLRKLTVKLRKPSGNRALHAAERNGRIADLF